MLTVTCGSVTKDGVWIIDQFNTRLVNTINYSAIVDLHGLQITTAHAKSFQSAVSSPVVPLATVSNSGYSSASALTYLPAGSQLHLICNLFTDPLTTD
jgi:hypothetical protein